MASNFDNAKKTSLDVNLFSYKMEDIHADSTSIRGGSDNINFSMPQSFTEFSGSRSVSVVAQTSEAKSAKWETVKPLLDRISTLAIRLKIPTHKNSLLKVQS